MKRCWGARLRAGVVGLTAAAVLIGCGSSSSNSGGSAAAVSGAAFNALSAQSATTQSSTVSVRFVILAPAATGPVDIVAGSSSATGPKLLTGITPGSVTDYVSVPFDGGGVAVVAHGIVIASAGITGKQGARTTAVIGVGGDSPTSTNYVEQNGVVVSQTTNSAPPIPSGKAVIIGDGTGLPLTPSFGLSPGQPSSCLATVTPDSGDIKFTLGHGGSVAYVAGPGTVTLTWFEDPACHRPTSAGVHTSIDAGHEGYAIAWMPAQDKLHLIFVPVNASGAGNTGVTDSGDGPFVVPGQTYNDSSASSSSDSTSSESTSSTGA